jgi:hypothetical protein
MLLDTKAILKYIKINGSYAVIPGTSIKFLDGRFKLASQMGAPINYEMLMNAIEVIRERGSRV